MQIGKLEFPDYLFKVCEKEEYIDQLLEGKLYMKESGYFRKLEDGFRGDPFDGRGTVDLGDTEVYLESEDGERIYLNGVPGVKLQNFTFGFSGDDKIPIFCACMMDERMVEVTGENSFRIKREYLDEMKKFGTHILFIPYGEMRSKLEEYNSKHPEIAFYEGPVRYTDIMKEYQVADIEDKSWQKEVETFFIKDEKYKYQNEWRILACAEQPLIGENTDFWTCDLGEFQYALKMGISDLENGEFHISS